MAPLLDSKMFWPVYHTFTEYRYRFLQRFNQEKNTKLAMKSFFEETTPEPWAGV